MKREEDNSLLSIIRIVKRCSETEFSLDMIEKYLDENIQAHRVKCGQHITDEDIIIRNVYYVVSGSFYGMRSSEKGKINILSKKRAPQFIGVDRAVNHQNASVSTNVALEDCIVLEIEKAYFLTSLKECGELGLEVLKNICSKISDESYHSDRILFMDSREKLLRYILEYWDTHHTGEECIIGEKNRTTADNLGVSVRTLQRILKELKAEGLLTAFKGNIKVNSEQIKKIRLKTN